MIPLGATCCGTEECGSEECLQLTRREEIVCGTVCTSETPLSFSRIKESSGLHQEVLSRILRRLSLYGALEKVNGKYRRKSVNKSLRNR